MLTVEQATEFRRRGIVCVDSLVPRADTKAMEEAVWQFLAARDHIDRRDPSTWPDGAVRKLQRLRKDGVFDAFMNDRLTSLADQLLGVGRWTHPTGPALVQPLITFPQSGAWKLPHKMWHFDLPARGPTDRLTALRTLGFVTRVESQGGGTLVIEGSHELVRRIVESAPDRDAGQSADVRRRLARDHQWFTELARPNADRNSSFLDEPTELDRVQVRVAELTGNPGDVYVMHPWVLHNGSPNVSPQPRMMATHTIYADDQPFFAGPARDRLSRDPRV